jgi:hypothetical protein
MIANTVARERRRRKEPLEVVLTVKFNFGDHPHEALTLVQERRVPLVGSIFDNRDRIAREFLRLLVKAGARQPGRLLGRRRKRGA